MKRCLLFICALTMIVCTATHAVATDLDLDPGYGTGGSYVDPLFSGHGMRAFTACVRDVNGLCTLQFNTYIAGFYNNGAGTVDAIVIGLDHTGNPLPNFGTGGRLAVTTGMRSINDVAFDPDTRRLYFVGAQPLFSTTSEEFAVTCLDIGTEAACAGFGNVGGGTELIVFDQGGSNNDIATRVLLVAGTLLVAGRVDGPNGGQLGIARLYASTGAPVTLFGGTGQVNLIFGGPNPEDVDAFDMTVSGARLYIAGRYKQTTGNYDGYALSMDVISSNSRVLQVISRGPASGGFFRDVAINAITVLANGKVAMAGTANLRGFTNYELLLVKSSASLAPDVGFCGTGTCAKPVGDGDQGWQNTLPSAIAERPGNRDLVVAMQAGTWHLNLVTNVWELSQKQIVHQYGASGTTLHASREMDFGGATPAAFSAGMTVTDRLVELIGWCQFGAGDSHITVTHFLANDSIFADQFGGPHGD